MIYHSGKEKFHVFLDRKSEIFYFSFKNEKFSEILFSLTVDAS